MSRYPYHISYVSEVVMRLITGRTVADTIRGTSVAEDILGLDGNDLLYGGGGDDRISGGNGNDFLYGEVGNDTLLGGAGDDRMFGGDGNDVFGDSTGRDYFSGGLGFDTLDYSSLATGRGVDVFLTRGIGGRDAAGDTYARDIENVTGSKFQDFLWGNGVDNVLSGGAGNDFLRGFAGNDTFLGGTGNDEMYGDAGNDVFRPGTGQDIIVGGLGTDTVNMSSETAALTIDFGQNKFSGPLAVWGLPEGDQIDAEVLVGTNFDDDININGQIGWNFTALNGAAGNDLLQGASSYFGGTGEDTIRLTTGRAEQVNLQKDLGYDKITFFDSAGGDRLVVSKSAFGPINTTGDAYDWVETTDSPDALAARASFIYETTTQILWFDGDGTGEAQAPIAIAGFYSPTANPIATDIVLVG